VAFDTEPTGLQPIVHRLVEGGAVRFRLDGHELATFQTLIDPHIPLPLDVQQVHGITDHMVRRQHTVEQVLPRFIEFLGASDTILLAHNALFDLSFLAIGPHTIRYRRSAAESIRHAGEGTPAVSRMA
jgi:DNA polymerase-3 subunit alpha (Gram-positive type)